MVAAAHPTAAFVGREAEREHLATLFARASGGEPSLCVVHGEAGIGKTALVRDACGVWAGTVVWGTCVHFGAATVPFAAVASAVDGWLADADDKVRDQVLDGLGGLTALLPSAQAVMEPSAGLLLQQLDRAIRRIAEHAPVVLVIDDLQWADPSSLDLLAFLVTGFRTQALSIVVTVRDEDRVDGHVLNSWLADLRRLPGVSEQHLQRLDLAATAEQVAALTGDAVLPAGFTASAFDRSGGNPYLTELLVQAGTSTAPLVTASVPVALREALLSRWSSMSAAAREVSRLLALAGRPVERSVLASVADHLGSEWDTGAALSSSLSEAV
ncbi:MAG: ATP-binding protein, partial [Ornithinibacter sp.]